MIGTYERSSPGCEDADNVHEEAGPHHVRDLQSAFIVHNGIGGRGHGEHEGVADAGGAGHHQVERVGAEREGHLTNQRRVQWSRDGCPPTTAHLGEDGDQDVGAGGVAGHLRDEGGHRGDDEADQQRVQALEKQEQGRLRGEECCLALTFKPSICSTKKSDRPD